MIISIHQPQYLPWLGYFHKIIQSDVFVLLDDVQYKKNEWQNRNRIRSAQEWQWITVPILHQFGQRINQIKINQNKNWQAKHINALSMTYGKTPFFSELFPRLKDILEQDWELLADLNITLIKDIVSWLEIPTRLEISSHCQVTSEKTQRLVDLCQQFGGDTYLTGIDGPNYMDVALFEKNNIKIKVQEFQHPEYPQMGCKNKNGFISHLSFIDLLFNCGKDSLNILNINQ